VRILILGGAGMLGHQLWRHLYPNHETWVTLRKPAAEYAQFGLFGDGRAFQVDSILKESALATALEKAAPEVVLNCVGIIKQLPGERDPELSIAVNSLFPHQLARHCASAGARMIHFSTDCVFSGHQGNYNEDDPPDPVDWYGRTKLLGEVSGPNQLTLRTSIIGPELGTRLGLLEWFRSQSGETVNGFDKAIYSGFTTLEIARIVENIITSHPGLSGIWHVASSPITKYELLKLFQKHFHGQGTINRDKDLVCDRSLDASHFNEETGCHPPGWDDMVRELSESLRV